MQQNSNVLFQADLNGYYDRFKLDGVNGIRHKNTPFNANANKMYRHVSDPALTYVVLLIDRKSRREVVDRLRIQQASLVHM